MLELIDVSKEYQSPADTGSVSVLKEDLPAAARARFLTSLVPSTVQLQAGFCSTVKTSLKPVILNLPESATAK